jgi:hypothetical protein
VGPPASCANCSSPRAGPYCQQCGQRAAEPDELRFGRIAREVVRSATIVDSKTARSLAALFAPGFLTAEYLAERRQPYLTPVKIYLVAAAIFFLGAPLAGFTLEALTARPGMEWLDRLATERRHAVGMDPAHFADRFDIRLQAVYTFMLGVSVIATAAVLALLFRRRRRPFGVHLVFALHYVAFLYLVALLLIGASWHLNLPPLAGLLITYGVIGPYLVIGIRRVYGGRLGATVLRVLALSAGTLVIDNLVNVAALLLTLRLV